MVSDELWDSNSFFLLKTISFTRIVFYGIATIIQIFVVVEGFLALGYFDIFRIVVPLVMIFIDAAMIKRGQELKQWFYLGYLVVTFLSILIGFIAMTTINLMFGYPGFPGFPYIQIFSPSTIAESLLRILSYGVIIVSFVQMIVLIYLTRPNKLEEQVEVTEEDLWLFGKNHDALGEAEDEGVLQ